MQQRGRRGQRWALGAEDLSWPLQEAKRIWNERILVTPTLKIRTL